MEEIHTISTIRDRGMPIPTPPRPALPPYIIMKSKYLGYVIQFQTACCFRGFFLNFSGVILIVCFYVRAYNLIAVTLSFDSLMSHPSVIYEHVDIKKKPNTSIF